MSKKSAPKAPKKSPSIPKDLYSAATPGSNPKSEGTPQPTNNEGGGSSEDHNDLRQGRPAARSFSAGGGARERGGVPPQTNNDMTVARMLGEIVWIMTQSPGHKHFALSDLEWMVMPALLLEQYRIFRNGDQPLGVALWAYLSPEAEEKLKAGAGRLRPDEWAVGMTLDPEDGVERKAGGALWLVDLICPFHTPENKMADQMLADMITGPFKGKKFKFHHTDPATGERKVMELGG
ncbi:toxin-activating lysine-acyltransferase [Paremcibacter congregatus]|uniref:toxin-activating lysine-acyltransferase n=1 Tax=Paremcibacter congregatus TaxID=2043170 RepID=UPI003A913F52